MKRILNYPTLLLFALFIMGFAVADAVTPDKVTSSFENRKLQQKPELTVTSFFDSSFGTAYETYINDQFAGRDQWISLKAQTEAALGKIENNGIVYGKNGYLFEKLQISPNPGPGAGSNVVDEKRVNNNIRFAKEFFEMYNLPMTFALAPNSYAVVQQYVPTGMNSPNQEEMIPALYQQINAGENVTFLNFINTLRAHNTEEIYYKTDHHWTTLGAYYAYVQYCQEKGLTPVDLSRLSYETEEDFYGTYYSKARRPGQKADEIHWYNVPVKSFQFAADTQDKKLMAKGEQTEFQGIPMLSVNTLYNTDKFDTRDKYAAFMWGNPGLAIVESENNLNKGEAPRRLLLVKDSYANSMIPFLTYNYDEIWVVDLRAVPQKMSQILTENTFDDIFIMYNFSTFLSDTNIGRLRF